MKYLIMCLVFSGCSVEVGYKDGDNLGIKIGKTTTESTTEINIDRKRYCLVYVSGSDYYVFKSINSVECK